MAVTAKTREDIEKELTWLGLRFESAITYYSGGKQEFAVTVEQWQPDLVALLGEKHAKRFIKLADEVRRTSRKSWRAKPSTPNRDQLIRDGSEAMWNFRAAPSRFAKLVTQDRTDAWPTHHGAGTTPGPNTNRNGARLMQLIGEIEGHAHYECACGEEVFVEPGSVRLPVGHPYRVEPPECPNAAEHAGRADRS